MENLVGSEDKDKLQAVIDFHARKFRSHVRKVRAEKLKLKEPEQDGSETLVASQALQMGYSQGLTVD